MCKDGTAVALEMPPSRLPAEGSFDNKAARQHREALGPVRTLDYLDDEIEIDGLVHKSFAVTGTAGEQMLQPRPALPRHVEDQLHAGAVGAATRYDGGSSVDATTPLVFISNSRDS